MKFEKTKEIKQEIIEKEKGTTDNNLQFGIDISKGPGASYGGNKFWILIVDNEKLENVGTDMCWSEFGKKKVN